MTQTTAPALFPLFLDLRNRRVLVVGGGRVAARKVPALLDAGADVVVVAPALDAALRALAASKRITHRPARFAPDQIDDVWLVLAATNNRTVNQAVADAAQARKRWVNVVDDAELASAQLPARVRRGSLQIAISSGGAAPMLARMLREQLETQFDDSFGALADLLARHRQRIRTQWPELASRRRGLTKLLTSRVHSLLRTHQHLAAEREFDRLLRQHAALEAATPTPGFVTLVGAGPGDPGLLTLRALRALNEADVILHDRLVSADVLELARRDAERIDVGKHAGGSHDATQARIHALMIEHARAGKHVVRLKGGDPFVFGRGGEELEALRAHAIAFEVVPGITAAVACAAYAGIPLTHRGYAQSLRLLTAHAKDGDAEHDWTALGRSQETLAFYMGISGLTRLRNTLIAHGRAASTPFALIENGTCPQQRVLTGTLATLPELAQHHRVQAPALLIVGAVAAFATQLHWYGTAPLSSAIPSTDADAPDRDLVRAA